MRSGLDSSSGRTRCRAGARIVPLDGRRTPARFRASASPVPPARGARPPRLRRGAGGRRAGGTVIFMSWLPTLASKTLPGGTLAGTSTTKVTAARLDDEPGRRRGAAERIGGGHGDAVTAADVPNDSPRPRRRAPPPSTMAAGASTTSCIGAFVVDAAAPAIGRIAQAPGAASSAAAFACRICASEGREALGGDASGVSWSRIAVTSSRFTPAPGSPPGRELIQLLLGGGEDDRARVRPQALVGGGFAGWSRAGRRRVDRRRRRRARRPDTCRMRPSRRGAARPGGRCRRRRRRWRPAGSSSAVRRTRLRAAPCAPPPRRGRRRRDGGGRAAARAAARPPPLPRRAALLAQRQPPPTRPPPGGRRHRAGRCL